MIWEKMADASGMASLSHLPLFTGMPDIAVSHAIQWSVDLDRVLRSSKPGLFVFSLSLFLSVCVFLL